MFLPVRGKRQQCPCFYGAGYRWTRRGCANHQGVQLGRLSTRSPTLPAAASGMHGVPGALCLGPCTSTVCSKARASDALWLTVSYSEEEVCTGGESASAPGRRLPQDPCAPEPTGGNAATQQGGDRGRGVHGRRVEPADPGHGERQPPKVLVPSRKMAWESWMLGSEVTGSTKILHPVRVPQPPWD